MRTLAMTPPLFCRCALETGCHSTGTAAWGAYADRPTACEVCPTRSYSERLISRELEGEGPNSQQLQYFLPAYQPGPRLAGQHPHHQQPQFEQNIGCPAAKAKVSVVQRG